jgi:hypothetical protein
VSTEAILQPSSLCPICNQECTKKSIERLPNTGILMKAVHKDGTEHKWAEYESIFAVLVSRKRYNPKVIVCPVCNKRGRVNDYRPNDDPVNTKYVVNHERTAGTWGKAQRVPRRRRCYIKTQEHRDIILMKLGRYIFT